MLPEVYHSLKEFVDQLPANDDNAAYPFAGLVVNLNVSTRAHRDRNDKDICLVIPISDCSGGGLILVEPGLILELENGDGTLFKSSRITHCNEHFVGLRGSLVFHTDIASDTWTVGRHIDDGPSIPNNGWSNNKHFRKM